MAPWKVEKSGSDYVIKRSDTGKVVGHSKTKKKALASMRARYMAVSGKE